MVVPLASALENLLSLGARQRNDRSVFEAQDVRHTDLALPRGLTLEWLGTAGFRITCEGSTLLIDPYFSRYGLLDTVSRRPLHAIAPLIERHAGACDAVLVGHTHFDHAIDVAAIARATGAKVYGSASLLRLMGLHGLHERGVEVVSGRVYGVGPFEITFIDSVHSKLALGLRVPFDGELSCDQLDDLRGSAYRCGRVYGIHVSVAGVTFYHQGSADLLDDEIVHRDVDFLLAGIAGRGFARNFTARILRRLSPRVVVPHHFDDFFRPLDEAMGFSLNVNLGGFVEEVRRVSSDFRVHTLKPLVPFRGPGGGT